MSSEKSKGIATSLIVHGLLGGSLILFSGINGTTQLNDQQGTMVIELQGDGDGAAGLVGKKPGLADGDLKGDKNKSGQFFDSEKVDKALKEMERDFKKIQEQQAKAEQQAREEQRRREQEAANKAKEKDTSTNKPPAKSNETGKKESLADFINEKGIKSSGSGKTSSNTNSRPSGTRSTGNGPRIGGVSVNAGVAVGGGGGFGVAGGTGENGGQGGKISSSAAQAYQDLVLTMINGRWQALLHSEGGALDSSISGKFRLNISNGGNISFGGWLQDPHNPLFESLLRRAIDQVGNCGSRPPGMPGTLNLPVDAKAN